MDSGEIRIFPGEIFDYLDTGKEFLEKLGALIGENHRLLTEAKHDSHESGLDRGHDEEDSKTSQSAGTEVDQEDDETDDQLDRSSPTGVEVMASGVDTRNVGGNVVDQLSIGMGVTSTSGERKSLVINRGDKSCA